MDDDLEKPTSSVKPDPDGHADEELSEDEDGGLDWTKLLYACSKSFIAHSLIVRKTGRGKILTNLLSPSAEKRILSP
jgi:hypothetical protein